ncbi:MAG: deoxyribose-phosphate aldolase [Bacilli bacterium]|nr:deoxyribose-phosphate aldolase [Bacilli bacterium]
MELNSYIDHTNLKKDALIEDIEKLCEEAMKYHFASVCVYPYFVKAVSEYLKGSNVEICTVVGFPNGMNTTNVKVYEAIDAIENGATEIDMVINISALKNKEYDYIKNEIEEIRDAIGGKTLKVIIETCLLTDEEIVKMTEICNDTFVNFIKTSTGFDKEGAKVEDIELINKHKGAVLEIKASGGIRDIETAEAMIKAGATRIGTSSGVKLMNIEEKEEKECNCNHEKHNCKCNHEHKHEHHECKCKNKGEEE